MSKAGLTSSSHLNVDWKEASAPLFVRVKSNFAFVRAFAACPAASLPANSEAMSELQSMETMCAAALKEWAVTCRALRDGRQILLLRKGGIADDYGVFALEHQSFWLQPTYEHQSEERVKPEHRDLFDSVEASRLDGENLDFIALELYARVERVWALPPGDEMNFDKLRRAPHIYGDDYLTLRLDYKPQHPLLVVALRVFRLNEPHLVAMRPEFLGCRSWIDLPKSLPVEGAPALADDAFARQLSELEQVLGI